MEERTGRRYMGLHWSNGYKVGVDQPRPIAALEVRLDDCHWCCGDAGASAVRAQAQELCKTSAANADKSPSPSPIIRIFSELSASPQAAGRIGAGQALAPDFSAAVAAPCVHCSMTCRVRRDEKQRRRG